MVSIHCIQFLFVKKTYKIDKKLVLNCSKFFVRESKELLKVLQLLSVKKDCLYIRDKCLFKKISV